MRQWWGNASLLFSARPLTSWLRRPPGDHCSARTRKCLHDKAGAKQGRLCVSSSLVWGPTLPAVLAGGWGKAPTLAGQPHTPTEPLPAQLSALRRGYEDPTSSSLAPLSLSQDLSVISEPFSLVGIFHTEAISNQRERTFPPFLFPWRQGV